MTGRNGQIGGPARPQPQVDRLRSDLDDVPDGFYSVEDERIVPEERDVVLEVDGGLAEAAEVLQGTAGFETTGAVVGRWILSQGKEVNFRPTLRKKKIKFSSYIRKLSHI
jgi:hypothetical protein